MTNAKSKSQMVRDLTDKMPVQSDFLIKFSAVQNGKNGKPYMNLVLMDRTGEVEARIWDKTEEYAGQLIQDQFVRVTGRCQLYQGRRQVVIDTAHLLREDEVNPKDFIRESAVDPVALLEKLDAYVESMEDAHYRELARAILIEDADVRDRIQRAPAAKGMHHAYRGGLLEHVVSITGIMDALSKHYGATVSRDLLFLGGFLHDIGKLWELTYERTTDYSLEGRLIGHHILGVELIERKTVELEKAGRIAGDGAFPYEKKLLVKHLVIAHHGKLEYGSPKEPATLEALLVHMVDDLDSKVNAVSQFIANDQSAGQWTALNRQFERFFYKGPAASN